MWHLTEEIRMVDKINARLHIGKPSTLYCTGNSTTKMSCTGGSMLICRSYNTEDKGLTQLPL